MQYRSEHPSHILFIFLDGIGLGDKDPANNPLHASELPAFLRLSGGQEWSRHLDAVDDRNQVFKAIDATLGVDGLPQSGTGQATLFTGVNCARLAGRHFGPYPHSKTKPVLSERNVFQQVNELPLQHPEPTAFANAYPERFFKTAQSRKRWTVTTLSCIEANVKIRTQEDLVENQALAADLTREAWRSQLHIPVEPVSEAQAAEHLSRISGRHPFTLFEYYLTDKAGHSQSMPVASKVLGSLDRLLGRLIDILPFERTLLLISSDHGNIEDLSTKTHTYNLVPLVAIGCGAFHFSDVDSIAGVTPAIIRAFS